MILIVGLGNIGEKYKNTRHNIGFIVIDALLGEFKAERVSQSAFKGELYKDGDVLFLKPSTYMNLSGESIQAVKQFYKPETLIIIHDDLDLPFGAIRFKVGGGTGGHNGLKSLDEISKKDGLRFRMGIGKPDDGREIVNFVLSNFSETEQKCLTEWVNSSKSAIYSILENSWEKTASLHSKKSIFEISEICNKS
jgi:PTH1 family peptidyl-tRNA hydrolase